MRLLSALKSPRHRRPALFILGTLLAGALGAAAFLKDIAKATLAHRSLFPASLFSSADVLDRLIVIGVCVVFWALAAWLLRRGSARWKLPALVTAWATFGLSSLFLLVVATLGTRPDENRTLWLQLGPWIAMGAVMGFSAWRQRQPLSPQLGSRRRWTPAAILLWAAAALLALHLMYWLAAARGPAANDELIFWWSALDGMHRTGLADYIRTVKTAGYDPGYPLMGNIALSLAHGLSLPWVDIAWPFFFGGIALALLLPFGRDCRKPVAVLLGLLIAYNILVTNDWVQALFFRRWYGESMAILSVTAVFLAIRDERHTPFTLFLTVGLGVAVVLSKPPLSKLIVPLAVVCGVMDAFLHKGPRRVSRVLSWAALAAGALITGPFWSRLLEKMTVIAYYSAGEETTYSLEPLKKIVPYVLFGFKNEWITFVATLAMGALWFRRYGSRLVFALAMVAAVLHVYMGPWKETTDFESSARYMMHGAHGWMLYFFFTRRRLMVRMLTRAIAR